MSIFKRYQRELYSFRVGPDAYHQTNGSRVTAYNGANYEPANVSRSDIKVTNEIETNNLEIYVKDDHPVALSLRVGIPEEELSLQLYQELVDTPGSFRLVFSGAIISKEFKRGHQTKLICQSLSQTAQINGLNRKLCKTCTYTLYDAETCKATPIQVTDTITSISGQSIIIAGLSAADHYYTGGQITVAGIKRTIASQIGDAVIPVTSIPASIGDSATVRAGCDKSMTTCEDKYSNLDNFGGQPYIPDDSPFQGSLV